MSEVKNIPRLRFPTFFDEWEIDTVSRRIDFLSGTPIKGDEILEEKIGTPILRGANIGEGVIRHSDNLDKYYNGGLEKLNKFLLKIGDLVIGMDGSKVGRNSSLINDEDEGSILIQRVARLRGNSTGNSVNFIFQIVNSLKFHRYVDSVKTSSGIPHISSKQINNFKIGFPSLKEQQKIADFLTAVDRRIELLEKKKTLLETYKKGVMKKIFNQEIRFKDENGNSFLDWEEKRLEDVLNYEQPTKYLVDSTDYSDSYDLPVLTAGKSFILGYTNETTGVYSNLPTIIFDDFTTSFHYVDFEFKMKSSAMKMLTVKSNNYNLKLVFEIMKNLRFVLSEHKRYWISEYSQMFISIPSIEEQTKISNFSNQLDTQIELLETQIDKSKTWKKGLLQKMFV